MWVYIRYKKGLPVMMVDPDDFRRMSPKEQNTLQSAISHRHGRWRRVWISDDEEELADMTWIRYGASNKPPMDGDYLVTLELPYDGTRKGKTRYIDVLPFYVDKTDVEDGADILWKGRGFYEWTGQRYEKAKVIAWMYLPLPEGTVDEKERRKKSS